MSATNCRVTVMLGGVLLSLGLAASYFATSLAFLFVTFGLIAGESNSKHWFTASFFQPQTQHTRELISALNT